jgi:chromosomal replication initiation ATPase DnaA
MSEARRRILEAGESYQAPAPVLAADPERWATMVKEYKRPVRSDSIKAIAKEVCDKFGLCREFVLDWTTQSVLQVAARQEICYRVYLARQDLTIQEIAGILGASNHSTILKCVQKYCAARNLPYPHRKRGWK